MSEQQAIEQFRAYKRLVARIRILEKVPAGNGMSVGNIYAIDKLQDLHKQLRGLPTYMYLTKKEQLLEITAGAYLTDYPTGTKAQLEEVKKHKGADPEDEKLLKELQRKIKKVIEARGGTINGLDAMLERIAELQDLEQEKADFERMLDITEELNPGHGQLLRAWYIEEKKVEDILLAMNISRPTFFRWRPKALENFSKISGCLKS